MFLGQILAYTAHQEFWDSQNQNSRLKQYQLDKYLRSIDDGWILQKAQYYRGAVQVEDEEAWGVDFYKWLLTGDTSISNNFFLKVMIESLVIFRFVILFSRDTNCVEILSFKIVNTGK